MKSLSFCSTEIVAMTANQAVLTQLETGTKQFEIVAITGFADDELTIKLGQTGNEIPIIPDSSPLSSKVLFKDHYFYLPETIVVLPNSKFDVTFTDVSGGANRGQLTFIGNYIS